MRKAHGTIYIGIDVSKDRLAVATAGDDRQDEVLSLGTFENSPASVDKLLKKLVGRGIYLFATKSGQQATASTGRCALSASSAVWSHRH